MLAKAQRLSRAAFSDCFAAGTRFHGTYLQIISQQGTAFRASVVVSKKVAKKATDRNKLRRQLYALLREVALAQGCSAHVIILVKPACNTLTRQKRLELCRLELGRALNTR